jgi:hypothetical protein
MAKPMKKRIEKRLRKGAKSIEKSIDELKPSRGPSRATMAGVAGVAVAGAAGVAAAVHRRRKGPRKATKLHVKRNGDREWVIAADGDDNPLGTFETKRAAVKAARSTAADVAPSDLFIHRSDGSVQESHSYETA